MDTTNIITSLNVNTQLPLDHKTYVYNFNDLLDLGLNQAKAFSYYIGMKVYCASNESTYIWREYVTPLESGGLIPNGFIYPNGILNETYNYSNKKFNFFIDQHNISSIPEKTSDLINDGSDSTSSYVELNELSLVATSNNYNDLNNLPIIPIIITDHSGINLDDGTNPHGTIKSDVGLSNVDNTSDLSKPISTATQTALDAKQATLLSSTNIKTINGTSILGSGDLVVSGGVSVDTSPKATNSLIVNGGLNGVINIGYFGYGGLTGGSFANVAGAYIRALSVTNMRSTAATAGSFTALRWEAYHGIGAKSKLVGFFAIGSTVAIADSRTFAGYYQNGFSLGNINYSAAAFAGFLNDSSDSNLQFCRVTVGGSRIKTDLGANFPSRYTDGQNEYKFLIEIVSTSTVNFKIKNLVNGAIASGSFTDLALNGAPVIGIAMNNNTTAVQTNLKFHSLIYQENYEF